MPTTTSELDQLLQRLVDEQGSDLHLRPGRPPLYRRDGRLEPLGDRALDGPTLDAMLDGIVPQRLRERLRRECAIEFGYTLPDLCRYRASVFIQRGLPAAVFRRVPIHIPTLEDWGLPPCLTQLCHLPQGLVLLTGPTGSGKSSTLAAMLREIVASRSVHVVTIEDPIEFLLDDDRATVTQREVGSDTPSFSTALRDALRHDPDVLMVGEMRDPETIQTVLTAAETGHLVFSTLHTNSAVQTVDRILDSFPDPGHRQVRQQLAHVLEAVVSLRLLPRDDGPGRIAAAEILRRTPRMAKLILQGKLEQLDEEIESSVSYHKMQSLNQSLAAMVLHGAIRPRTALGASPEPAALDLILRNFLGPELGGRLLEDDTMTECLSDFSKIVELQETNKLYHEMQERHAADLDERDARIAELEARLDELTPVDDGGADAHHDLKSENERLSKQLRLERLEYESKLERLNERLRRMTGRTARNDEREPEGAASRDGAERRGFFKR